MSTPENTSPYYIATAKIDWQEHNLPASSHYEDIYFSKQQGLEETRYVFLQHNQLKQRWQQLDPKQPGCFTIAETGFGTGLNFLAAWELWQECAPSNWQLHFISVEKHPLKKADLQRALSAWPRLKPFADALIDQYPPLVPGHRYLRFAEHAVHLHLLLGDAEQGFQSLLNSPVEHWANNTGAKVDAWFLDGFTPSRNPSMWTEALFALIAKLSKTGTTLATFTAASIVRRGLQQYFVVEKAPGFGRKREMLKAFFRAEASGVENTTQKIKKAQTPWHIDRHPIERPTHVAVIGGGLAGCTTARALANRGIRVSLLERNSSIASEASGNAQGMLYTKLSAQLDKANQFHLSSYFFATTFYQQLIRQGVLDDSSASLCGLLQLLDQTEATIKKLQVNLQGQDWVEFLSSEAASEKSGLECFQPGYFLKTSGWISPPKLCRALLQHPLITVKTHSEAINLQQRAKNWQLLNREQQLLCETNAIVIANSHDAKQFNHSAQLPLKIIRGQTSAISQTSINHRPNTVVCHEGYLTPCIDQQLRFGASFKLNDSEKSLRETEHRDNLRSLHKALPTLLKNSPEQIPAEQLSGRANLRCTSPDYLPIVGKLPQQQAFIEDFQGLSKDASLFIDKAGSYYPGLFINVAHGSRGLTSTPLCAELLAADICQEPQPLPQVLLSALNPARFIIKALIQNRPTS